jgi:c-di-GMP-binding flagellar brake protein YcgR
MAPVLCRAPRILTKKRRVANLSLVGVRIYSDENLGVGERLELEFFQPDGSTIEAIARVVWIKGLLPGSEAVYDLGLEFVELPEAATENLKKVLK